MDNRYDRKNVDRKGLMRDIDAPGKLKTQFPQADRSIDGQTDIAPSLKSPKIAENSKHSLLRA